MATKLDDKHAGMAAPKDSPSSAKAPRVPSTLRAPALDGSMAYLLRRAQLSTYNEYASAMDQFDIRPSQFAVLALIHANPGQTQSAIGLSLGVQKANFVALFDKLEAKGLVERRKRIGDRRSSALHLTAPGQSLIKKLLTAHLSLEEALLARLGERDSRMLLRLLTRFAEPDLPHS